MSISIAERLSEVEIKAHTELECDFLWEVGKYTARIKHATVYWEHEDASWNVSFVQIKGPVIRKSDGAESQRKVSEATHMPGHERASSGPVTPPEIVEYVLAHPPQWVPNYREVRTPDAEPEMAARSSEERPSGLLARTLSRWSRRRNTETE